MGKTAERPATDGASAGLTAIWTAVETAPNSSVLQELVQTVVVSMLRRAEDESLRRRTLATISGYFTLMRANNALPVRDKLAQLRLFARQTIQIVMDERPVTADAARRMAPTLAEAAPRRRAADAPVAAPTPAPAAIVAKAAPEAVPEAVDITAANLGVSDVERPTAIHTPEPPAPAKFATFRELLPAALHYRLCSLMRFFQRSNGDIARDLPKPFLLTAEFETRFMAVVNAIIVPKMFSISRNLAALEVSRRWDEVSTATFWAIINDNEKTRISLVAAWEEAWNTCRQRESWKKGEDGERKRVLVAAPELKRIRDMLTPDTAATYDIPPIRNREIDLFVSLLTDFDLIRLEYCFTKLRQMYEQEMDRRWYQDRARDGALRDSLLEAIDAFPDRTGDFLALVCYFCFPNTDLAFLDRFTHNKGSNHAARLERLPYLMRFLAGDGIAAVRSREDRERREREAAAKAERDRLREAEREASARLHG